MTMLNINNKMKQAASNSWAKHPTDSAKAIGEANLRKAEPDIFGREPDNRSGGKKKKGLSEVTVGQQMVLDYYKHSIYKIPSGRSASSIWMNDSIPEPIAKKHDYLEHLGEPGRWYHLGGKITVRVDTAERNKRDRKMDCTGTVIFHELDGWRKSLNVGKDDIEYKKALSRFIGTKVKFKI